MELDITRFFTEADPFTYSHSRMEAGDNACRNTWDSAVADAPEWNHLDTEEKREAFRDYVKGFGAWTVEEIAAWDNAELEALFLQMVSGDIREADLDDVEDEEQWAEYKRNAEAGRVSSRIYRAGGKVYYYVGD